MGVIHEHSVQCVILKCHFDTSNETHLKFNTVAWNYNQQAHNSQACFIAAILSFNGAILNRL
jgi:hypothetical protein